MLSASEVEEVISLDIARVICLAVSIGSRRRGWTGKYVF